MRRNRRRILGVLGAMLLAVGLIAGSVGSAEADAYSLDVVIYDLTYGRSWVGGSVTSNIGIDCGPDCYEFLLEGTGVTLSASAAPGYVFVGWGLACAPFGTEPVCSFTHSSATTGVHANFEVVHTLTVDRNSAVGTVISTPLGINCGEDCSEAYIHGTQVNLVAVPGPGYVVEGWDPPCDGANPSCIVSIGSDRTVTALFNVAPVTPELTVVKAGTGTGEVSGTGIACGSDCTESYPGPTSVTLTATPSPDSIFAGWSGGGCVGTGTCILTVDGSRTVTASFTPRPVAHWSFDDDTAQDSAGAHHGTLTGSGLAFAPGQVGRAISISTGTSFVKIPSFHVPYLTVSAWVKSAKAGYYTSMVTKSAHPIGWNPPWQTWQLWFHENTAQPGFNRGDHGNVASPETIPLNQWVHLAGSYDGTTFRIYVNGVEKANASAPVPGPLPETLGNIYIGAPEFSNHSFLGLIDEVALWDRALGAEEIAAQYQRGLLGQGYLPPSPVQMHALAVERQGAGAGSVTSSPAGIACGATCSADFDAGTSVTLTATPDGGSTFAGWGGACAGSDLTCALTLSDGNTVTATVGVGLNPYGVVVNPAGTRIYVTNDSGASISVIETATNTVTATVNVGKASSGLAIDPAGTRLYVANELDNTISVVDTSANAVTATVPVGAYPFSVAVHPDGTRAYAANYSGNTVSVINTSTNEVTATVPVGTGPSDVAVNPAGTRLFVANENATVSVIDTTSNTVITTVYVTYGAWKLAVNPAGTRVYATGKYTGTVSVIDTVTNTVTATVPAGATPQGVTVDPTGMRVYVTNWSGTVSVIDTASNTVTTTVPVGAGPVGVAMHPDGTRVYVANNSGNTVSVIDTTRTFVTATFEAAVVTYSLTVARAGTGAGTVTSTTPPGVITCGSTCSASLPSGTAVTLVATPDATSTFAGWSGGGCAGTGTCTVTLDAAKSVTATFTRNTYALTVTKSGAGSGTVTSSPAGIACGPTCSAEFQMGTSVTLNAMPAVGSTFAGWMGACAGTGSCTLTLDTPQAATAVFTPTSYSLAVSRSGGGTVTSSPAGIACGSQCDASFSHGTSVTLTAIPEAGRLFAGWSGACAGAGSNPVCMLTMDGARSATATFALQTFPLSVSRAGAGSGQVVSTPAGIGCGAACAADLPVGSGVILTAVPDPGSMFFGWNGGCTGTAHCILQMTGPTGVSATFLPASLPQIHLGLPAPALGVGEPMTVTATITPGPPATADVYIALQLPDASLLFLRGDGSLVSWPQAIAGNWGVAPYAGQVFNHTFTGGEPAGSYRWLAALMVPGTLTPLTGVSETAVAVWPGPPPALRLALNATGFRTGEPLAIGLALSQAPGPVDRDVYVALQLPDGSLLFLTGEGGATPTPTPYLARWTGAATVRKVFAYTFSGGEPAGTYTVLAGFAEPGTLNFLGPVVPAPFSFAP